MRMREAVIAGLPLYSPRLFSPDPPRPLSRCVHSGREESACLDAHGEKLNEMHKNTQMSTFRLVHKYLHHMA